jgi:eukaryotic translation initiation factor 2C
VSLPSLALCTQHQLGFRPDGLQQLSFALCHVYARATRSVSIPAPVYCESTPVRHLARHRANRRPLDADIVCARAKHHFDPDSAGDVDLNFSESAEVQSRQSGSEGAGAARSLQRYKDLFKPLNPIAAKRMYCKCSVSF